MAKKQRRGVADATDRTVEAEKIYFPPWDGIMKNGECLSSVAKGQTTPGLVCTHGHPYYIFLDHHSNGMAQCLSLVLSPTETCFAFADDTFFNDRSSHYSIFTLFGFATRSRYYDR